MRIAVIQSPTADNATPQAITRAGMVPVIFSEEWVECDGYVITCDLTEPFINLLKQQAKLNKPLLGIGEGSRLLVESGLVPGLEHDRPAITLAKNTHGYGEIIKLTDEYQYNAFTRLLKPDVEIAVPVANVDWQFVMPPGLLLELRANGLDVFRYTNNAVAALSNKTGNVMAVIPPIQQVPEGDIFFQSMREYIAIGYKQSVMPLSYQMM